MPHVLQSKSALARVESYISKAKAALAAGDLRLASEQMDYALGAVAFAANTQTKLIDASRYAAKWLEGMGQTSVTSLQTRTLREAIAHAEGPGID